MARPQPVIGYGLQVPPVNIAVVVRVGLGRNNRCNSYLLLIIKFLGEISDVWNAFAVQSNTALLARFRVLRLTVHKLIDPLCSIKVQIPYMIVASGMANAWIAIFIQSYRGTTGTGNGYRFFYPL